MNSAGPDRGSRSNDSLSANPALMEAHLRLVQFFGQQEVSFDPWWWPMNSGSSLEDYGLDPHRHSSLRDSLVLYSPDAHGVHLHGCRGSVAAEPGCAAIITTRPSSGAYPGKSGIMVREVANPEGSNPGPNIHITDLVKFRGVGGDGALDRGVDLRMWKASLDCLNAELKALKPDLVLVSKGARRAIQSWLSKKGKAFGRWAKQLSSEHETLLQQLMKEPYVPSLTPRYFGGADERRRVQKGVVEKYQGLLHAFLH